MRIIFPLLGLLIFCAACTQPSTQNTAGSAVVAPVVATPEAVAAQLNAVEQLAEAAQQLAVALGVAQDQVRVRIRLQNCITCNLEENAAATSREGLSVTEAIPKIEPDMMLWLFVQNFTCTYTFDGEHFVPQTCQVAPL